MSKTDLSKYHNGIIRSGNEGKDNVVQSSQKLVSANQELFDNVVTRNYLQLLDNCEVIPMDESKKYSDFRWFRITKIVKEKDTYFTDKLSMLYMSLHKTARNVVLVLNKQKGQDLELYLGARDMEGNKKISGKILESGIKGYFPGMTFEYVNDDVIRNIPFDRPSVSSVSAVASLRDDKKEHFVQGLERLINATAGIGRFRVFFIAEKVSNEEATSMMSAFNSLYTNLSPAENIQLTYNENQSHSVSETLSQNFSESIGESLSQTITHTEGTSKTTTEGTSISKGTSSNHSRNLFTSLWHGLVGGETSNGTSYSETNSRSTSYGSNYSNSEANQHGTNKNTTKGDSTSNETSDSSTKGLSEQITYKNRSAKFYLAILDKQIERLQNGIPFGLWSVATYFVANDSTTAQVLANIYRGTIIGEDSSLESCAINTWNDSDANKILKYLTNEIHPRFNYNTLPISAASVVNSKELAIHLSLPQTSVPGVIVEERATFARNVFSNKKPSETLQLGYVSHLRLKSTTPVELDVDELTKHVFVTGSTGSGKSNTMYLLLSQLRDNGKTFMVIEPAKGEYKNVFGNLPDVTVYSHTHKVGQVLKINPFEFPYKHIEVLEHIERIVSIFNACWSLYAAMPSILKHSIITAYEKCGWDMDTSTNKLGKPIFPSMEDVVVCLKDYLDHSDYSPETKGDYKGALEKRLQDLCEGIFDRIFNRDSLSNEDLFNKNVIVDLSRTGSSETNALIMGFLITKLNEFRMAEGGMNRGLRHVMVLEEAHNLLRKVSTSQSTETANVAGKSVEMITNSIAEMRTYGESFFIVDQSPSLLDSAAIRNTNTKIVLSLPEAEDRKAAGLSMSLSEEQIEEIARQKQGEAIVYQNSWEEPVQCKVDRYVYDEKAYYNKMSAPEKKQIREYHEIVIDFLLYPSIQKPVSRGYLEDVLQKSVMPNSIRFTLLDLYNQYKEEGNLEIWKDYNFTERASVVRQYLNLDSVYSNITHDCTTMAQARVRMDVALSKRLGSNLDIKTIYSIEQCYVRMNARYNEWRATFLNKSKWNH
ncbi:ATP-binding protein [Hallella mizrahii]|uniref:ATP-binding protein n=1 Tax=Hallella mizrahii TaxID=2606637 RepID=A0A7K0KH21_9BACT|nr:ATP-binding protein [Hallella mizrahii]MST85237.1 ATP-binding protein [Hallella mizrahii]